MDNDVIYKWWLLRLVMTHHAEVLGSRRRWWRRYQDLPAVYYALITNDLVVPIKLSRSPQATTSAHIVSHLALVKQDPILSFDISVEHLLDLLCFDLLNVR
jgi:hypothetical protein